MIVTIELPIEVKKIIERLNNSNFECYVVGGAIRDNLLNRSIEDYDLTTNASVEEIKRIFFDHKTIEINEKRETIVIIKDGLSIEVTTYRNKEDFTIRGDLSLRDFTINSLAYNHKVGLLDYFNGLDDLNNRVIRSVNEPSDRFREDPLRMLRAIRFASVYDYEIETKTSETINREFPLLAVISKERIRDEFSKIIVSEKAARYIEDYFDVFSLIIKELKPMQGFDQRTRHHDYDCLKHSLVALENIENDLVLKLAALFHDSGKPASFSEDASGQGHFYGHEHLSAQIARNVLRNLKYDNKTIGKVTTLIRFHMYPLYNTKKAVKKLINKVGEDNFFDLMKLKRADTIAKNKENDERLELIESVSETARKIIKSKDCFDKKSLNIDGYDLIELGQTKRQIGKNLDVLLKLVINEKLPNNKQVLMDYAKTNFINKTHTNIYQGPQHN